MIFPHWEEGGVWSYDICSHVLFILLTPSFHRSLSLELNWVTWSKCRKEPSCVFSSPPELFSRIWGFWHFSPPASDSCWIMCISRHLTKENVLILWLLPPTQLMPEMSPFIFSLPPSDCWILTNEEAFRGSKHHQEVSLFLFFIALRSWFFINVPFNSQTLPREQMRLWSQS